MLYDIHRRYPWAYVHRHKLQGWTAPFKHTGQSEITMWVKMIDQMMVNATNEIAPTNSVPNPLSSNKLEYTMKQVYTRPLHIVADNFFSRDVLMDGSAERNMGSRPRAHMTASHLN